MKTLEDLYEDTVARLPTQPKGRIVLNGATCVPPPTELVTTQLKLLPSPLGHDYGDSARYDTIHFFADKVTYRRLGLLLFSCVFHPNREITLHLQHPESKVTKLRIECPNADPLDPRLTGLASVPQAFGYEAVPVGHIHPLWREEWRIEGRSPLHQGRAGFHLPFCCLTNESGRCGNPEEFDSRNIVEGFGGAEETATFGALLLDIGLTQTELTEMHLESPSGNWSVAIGSAEARLWVGYDFQ